MISEYLNYLQQVRNLSKHTIKSYRQDLIHFTEYARRNSLTWSTITKQDLVDYQLEIANENLSPASRSRMTSSLRQCLQYAVNMGYLSENPARYLQSPKKEHRLPQTADMADIMAYLRTTPLSEPDRMLHALVALLTDTGIRLQEALDIRRKDINKDEHSILIHGKGNKERKVYYSDLSATHLNRYAKYHQDYIFEERDQKEIRYQMYAFVGQMIKGAHPHLFRHTYATEMLKRGCDINTLRKLMGHESVKTTEIYAQVEDETAREKAMKYSPLN